jgi:hypothetical protein
VKELTMKMQWAQMVHAAAARAMEAALRLGI